MGQLSLKAALLFPLIWINCDDQGRVSGNPHEIKYACCPNIEHITKTDISELLDELQEQRLINVYTTSKAPAIQMLDWWDVQKLQWAYPSDYPPAEGWPDHLRYHPTPKEIITKNWPPTGQLDMELLPSKLPSKLPSNSQSEVPQTLPTEDEEEKEEGRGNRRGRGRGILPSALPSALGSNSSPSLVDPALFQLLVDTFPQAWGRMPDSRETAQLRDLGNEISSAGATAEQVHDAFKEAATQNKLHVSYVRAILLDWLSAERNRSP